MATDAKNRNRPFRAVRPGEILEDELDARCWTQGDFAEIIGRPVQAINEIVAGKKAITPETALLFSRALGTTAEFWLNLEAAYRLDLLHKGGKDGDQVARKALLYSIAPVRELTKRNWIRRTKNIEELEREVCSFYGIASPGEQPKISANFRRSDAGVADAPSLLAWVRKAELEAGRLDCRPFDSGRLRASINELPAYSSDERKASVIQGTLCDFGIRLVFVAHLPRTRVDGAAFWLDKSSPVIAMSLRLDRIDNFWFTLMHELLHIIEGSKNATGYLDQDIANEPETEVERRVNQKARDLLIPRTRFDAFVKKTRPFFSRAAVLAFALELGIHPAIVVGRLQHEKLIPFTNLRNLLGKASPLLVGRK
ncbi:MAG: HigA family addiction module antitoxin [Nitrospiraceae bacterium]|nr:HigA family addiction module antitoxin [Nitrospiraceae bacterium]